MYYRRSNGCICQPSRGANIPKLGLCWVPRKGACTSQDRREELLTIRHFPPTLAVGDLVRITGKGNVALRAVLLAFMLPTLLILAGALVLSKAGVGDALMVLSLLLILVMYALVLVLLRPFLDAQLALRAEPITQQP